MEPQKEVAADTCHILPKKELDFLMINNARQTLFEVVSKLGITIRTTRRHWKLISEEKHPEIKNKEKKVMETLKNPKEIRLSKKDEMVYLYYKACKKNYYCVVVKHLNGEGFIITAYITKNIKEGILIWKK